MISLITMGSLFKACRSMLLILGSVKCLEIDFRTIGFFKRGGRKEVLT